LRVCATLACSRRVEKGAGIGYGHSFRAEGPLRLATISFGYADGWLRRSVSAAWFEGVRLPFLGRLDGIHAAHHPGAIDGRLVLAGQPCRLPGGDR
ncbi:hypothetical protein EN805_34720, partial [bacterium M00.F.Ca.ET.162.01.1.1]